jgi:hypothetical protein
MRTRHATWSLALALCMTAGPLLAQAPAAPQPAPPPACTATAYHQFDYFLGHWNVTGGADGKTPQGTSWIEPSENGCWITEHWHGARGSDGTSLNAWDAVYGVWRQFWTGADGTVLRLQGGLHDGAMVMEGELPKRGGGIQRQKISWTPKPDGSVVQHWQTSDDEGRTWQTSFLGVYRHDGGSAQ